MKHSSINKETDILKEAVLSTIHYCFPGGKHKVLTMSYDDGRSADRRLVEIFNRHGIKGTFNINAGFLGGNDRISPDEVKNLYNGHEIAAHTYTHPTIARCPKVQVIQQIFDDRKALESLADYPVRGMAYPNGSYDNQIKEMLPGLGIEYARTTATSQGFSMPLDFYSWEATCSHKQELMHRAEEFLCLSKKAYLFMMMVRGHSYEFDIDQNWDLIESFSRYMGQRDDIWYATNIEIVNYINAFNNLKFSASCDFVYNPFEMSVWLNVNNKIIEVKGGSKIKLIADNL